MDLVFTSQEIEQTVKDGMFTAFSQNRNLNQSDVIHSIRATYPLAKTMREPITKMREWASARARLASSQNNESLEIGKGETPVPSLRSERRNIFDED